MTYHRGLCIVNAYLVLPGAQHFYERMKEELARLDVALDLQTNATIYSSIDREGKLSGPALPYDFILYLDKDLYASFGLEDLGYRLFNQAKPIELCDDKMRTHLALANQGIAMPLTISGPLNYSSKDSPEFVRNLEKKLVYPIVAKENFGSLGERVFLLKGHSDLLAFENEHRSVPRLYQEFIASSQGKDYRVIVIGGKVAAAMKRVNLTDFRSNIALGGHGEKTDLPQNFANIAEKTADILDLDYCGVDLLIGENKEPILCEVNSNAFIGGIEPVSGINVAAIYARHIQKTIYEKIHSRSVFKDLTSL